MAAATRMHLAEKGKDPRAYTLFAFGGAGPVHAYALAKLLKMRRIIVPMGAGVISALGFLVAAPAVDEVRGYVSSLDRVDWDYVNGIYAEMEASARALLLGAGGDAREISLRWSADMRYLGQGFEITVDIPRGPWARPTAARSAMPSSPPTRRASTARCATSASRRSTGACRRACPRRTSASRMHRCKATRCAACGW